MTALTSLALVAALTVGQVLGVIRERAAVWGVDGAALERLVWCESSNQADVVGDNGHSHGLAQLSDRATGLLGHFHAVGYESAYNGWEAVDYLARVMSGEWAEDGVTVWRWSCWRLVRDGGWGHE